MEGLPMSTVIKLNDTNYQLWKHQIKLVLKAKKVWFTIETTKPDPPPPDANTEDRAAQLKLISTYEEKSAVAASVILIALEPSQGQQVINIDEAREIWLKLQQIHEGKVSSRRVDLRLELSTIKKENSENVEQFLARAQYIRDQLAQCGSIIQDEEYIGLLLNGLPKKYNMIRLQMKATGLEKISMEEFRSGLKAQEDEISLSEIEDKMESARLSKKQERQEQRKPNKPNVSCWICNKPGHYARNCYYRADRTEHPRGKSENSEKQFRRTTDMRNGRNDRKDEKVNNTTNENYESAMRMTNNDKLYPSTWYIDSGATSHMTYDKSAFINLTESETEKVKMPDGSFLDVKGTGTIRVKTTDHNCKYQYIQILNVLYVPEIRENLLSVSTFEKKGYVTSFEDGTCRIKKKDDSLMLTGKRLNNLYEANIVTATNTKVEKVNKVQEDNAEIWHRRFGHQNMGTLNQMRLKGIVDGLKFENKNDFTCTDCIQGKAIRQSFDTHDEITTTDVLELIHMDLCGPMGTLSIAQSKYMYVLIDDYSRKIFIYFLKTKDEAFSKFKLFKSEIENQTGKKIKRIRSDNGGEFVNDKFKDFLEEHGIKHERTVPYTPEENGIAERTNRTIIQMIRCMLIDSKLPQKFWAEAAYHAVYIKNRTFMRKINKTPEEKFSGKKPNVKNFKVFGSLAYYLIEAQKRKKLDATSKEAIFVGYDHTSKHYRLYSKEREAVIIVRDAKIIEDKKGAEVLFRTTKNETLEELIYVPINIENENELTDYENDKENQNVVYNEVQEPENDVRELDNEISSEYEYDTDDSDIDDGAKDTSQQDPTYQIGNINLEEPSEVPVRRSERIQAKQQNRVNLAVDEEIPKSYEEALQSRKKERWKNAIEEEIKSHEVNKTWEIVNRPKNKTIIDSKWVFKIKENPNETVNKFKARLVARGYNQIRGEDYDEVFSPVIRLNTLRIIIALAVEEDLELYQYDVTTAYLNGVLHEEVYMEIPDGISGDKTNKVCKLKKGLYGLKQSAKTWYTTIKNELKSLGFKELYSEACVFLRTNNKGDYIILCLYVDDILIATKSKHEVDEVIILLGEKFDIKSMGKAKYLLGWEIERNETNGTIHIRQEKYINKILRRFHMQNCKGTTTPMEQIVANENNNDSKKQKVEEYPYQELIGSLMYLSQGTRPDITFATTYLSQFNKNFTEKHWKQAKHVLRYLQQTKSMGIKYQKANEKQAIGYSDASWNNNTEDGKGFSSYIFILAGGAITWQCKKQAVVALSTCESEFMAITEGIKEWLWLKKLFNELKKCKQYLGNQLMLKTDNQAAIKLCANNMYHSRTKHIQRRYFLIRDEIERNNIKIDYIRTEEMAADFLTKPVTKRILNNCRAITGIISKEEF